MSKAETDDPTSALLQNDDAIDSMTDMEVKDAWVRGQFMHQIIKANGPRFMRTDDCDTVERMLSECSNATIRSAAIQGLGRTHSIVGQLGWEDGPGNVETLLDILTKEGVDTDAMVPDMRDTLKSALRGSGMPRISVMRARVRAHTGE